jgi:N utilization substance protein B
LSSEAAASSGWRGQQTGQPEPRADQVVGDPVEEPDPLTGSRTKARKRALDILFEADQRHLDVMTLLKQRMADPGQITREYSVQLVEGVSGHLERIDELLTTYAHGWTLDRMPAVDRALLRMATWELLYNDDVPDAVAIDEAVLLARTLSTDESPGFVNGLLARLLETKASR